MVAREGVVRPQLGEDGDHGLADGVAVGSLLGGGERILQVLEGGGVVAAVPRREGLFEPVPVLGQPGAGGQAGGQEVVREGLCLLYTSPSPRDRTRSRMPSSA